MTTEITDQQSSDETRAEIRALLTQAGGAIVQCIRRAQADGVFRDSVVVVKLVPAATDEGEAIAVVMLCDRLAVLADPPRDMLRTQIEMLAAAPVEGVMLVLLYAAHASGVGAVTVKQADDFEARKRARVGA